MILFLFGFFVVTAASAEILDLWNGQACTSNGGVLGTCRLLSNCTTIGDFRSNHPPICNFRGKDWEPIVCCPLKHLRYEADPDQDYVKPGQRVERICNQLYGIMDHIYKASNTITILGFTPSRENIAPGYGASVVPPRAHPYMALIGYCGADKTDCGEQEVMWGCGGSLITPYYVLSAAHCAFPYSLGPAKWARLGDLDISTSADDAMPVSKGIIDIIVHPKYRESQVYHDIALFKLDSRVVFNGYVLPVCLHTERHIEQKKANFTGWGRTAYAEGTSEKLLEAEIDIYNDTECARLMFGKESSKSPLGLQPDLMMCAGVPDGSKDACPGDSGGPLVVRSGPYTAQRIQVGITSYGDHCGLPDSPGVYTRVSNYISWIEEIAFKDVFVPKQGAREDILKELGL